MSAREIRVTDEARAATRAEAAALDAARVLVAAGVPVFVAPRATRPDGTWDEAGGSGGCGYWLPRGWQQTVADPAVIDTWEPGMALCAVMGHRLDLADVDDRNGGAATASGLRAAGMWPTSYAEAATPSGGTHDFVATLGVRSRDAVRPGLDIKAGDRHGKGRGFAFIAPTVKLNKVTGELATYTWTRPPDPDELAEADGDDTGQPIAEMVRAAHGSSNGAASADSEAGADRVRDWMVATPIPVGSRYPWLRSYAGWMRRRHVGKAEAKVMMRTRWEACEQPADYPMPWADALALLGDIYTRYEVGDDALDDTEQHEDDQAVQLDVICAADVKLTRVRYVWERRIPVGAMTVLPGEEGIGKTTVGVRLIANLTRGTLEGEHYGTPRDVIVLAAEDGLADVFVPRLEQAGADLSRVHIVRARFAVDGTSRDVIIPRDLDVIGAEVRKHNAAMVWIDSLVTTLPDELKSISYKEVAKALKAIGKWAEAEGVAVAAPWHLNKASGTDTAVRMMDSRAFRTAVRSVLLIVADPEADEGVTQGLVALDKANAGPLAVPALRYRIRSAQYEVTELDETTGELRNVAASCGVADWIGTVDGDGREIARATLAPRIEKDNDPKAWLHGFLTNGGETLRVDVIEAAEQAGFSRAAIERAAPSLPVHSRDENGQHPDTKRPYRRSWWSLPPSPLVTDATEGTEGTGEGSSEGGGGIGAGQAQSPQSPQSPPCRESEGTGDVRAATGPSPLHPPAGEADPPVDPVLVASGGERRPPEACEICPGCQRLTATVNLVQFQGRCGTCHRAGRTARPSQPVEAMRPW